MPKANIHVTPWFRTRGHNTTSSYASLRRVLCGLLLASFGVACGGTVEGPAEQSLSDTKTLCAQADEVFSVCGTPREKRPGPFHFTDDACYLTDAPEVYQCNLDCLESASCEQLNAGCVDNVDGGGCVSQDKALWSCIYECW